LLNANIIPYGNKILDFIYRGIYYYLPFVTNISIYPNLWIKITSTHKGEVALIIGAYYRNGYETAKRLGKQHRQMH